MIVANLATYPPRAASLARVVVSMAPQVDRLNVVLNEYDALPEDWDVPDNVIPIFPPKDLKDTGKFWPAVSGTDWVVLIDDDLCYPDDYVATSLKRIESSGASRSVYGYHGTYYRKPGLKRLMFWKYPRLEPETVMRYRRVHTFWNTIDSPMRVDQLGTGTCFVRGEDMPDFDFMDTSQKFVDVRFALWCSNRDLQMVCLPRPRNWLTGEDFEETIFEFTQSNPRHVAAEIWQYAYQSPDVGKPLLSTSGINNHLGHSG